MQSNISHIIKAVVFAFMFALFMIAQQSLYGQIITVKQDGSGNFTQIQPAIDASQDGDTVLVWPGTYVENLKLNHKGISLASLHLTTNDPIYIDQTIIDGNQTNSCIYYDTVNHPSLLQGFTITNGQGNINTSRDPGGGIWVKSSELEIISCKIVRNKAGNGGGIYLSSSVVSIINSRISHNFANQEGGGLYVSAGELSLSGTSICYNHAYMDGGGIVSGIINFDSINLCNIYCNYGCPGSDIASIAQYIPLDTFTVDQPESYHLYSCSTYNNPVYPTDIIASMQNSKTTSVNADLYVSPTGSDTNSGLTPEEPLQHLAFAMAKIVSDSTKQNTIYLAEGIYTPSMGERFPMSMRTYIDVIGAGPEATILDAEQSTTHIKVNKYYHSYGMHDLTIYNSNGNYHGFHEYVCGISILNGYNINLKNVHFKEGVSRSCAACAMSETHQLVIDGCVFESNHGNTALKINTFYYYEDTVLLKADTVVVRNTIFNENKPPGYDPELIGGAGAHVGGTDEYNDSLNVYFINCAFTETEHYSEYPQFGWTAMGAYQSAKATAVNCTFTGNYADNPNIKALGVTSDAEMSLYNCILYNNPQGSMYMYSLNEYPWDTCKLNVYYSLFEGGQEEILQVGYKNVINYAASNIDTDPMFYNQGEYPYYLQAGSPCIDAGTLELPPEIELPETDLAGNPRVHNGYIDMGAYEHGPWVGIEDFNSKLKTQNSKLISIWPNPFSHEATIQYQNPEKGKTQLKVYDLNGRCVRTLMDVQGQAGSGELRWDGRDGSGLLLGAGTYILCLIVNGKEKSSCKVIRQ